MLNLLVVQTELLRDYYLVPGAEWSLLKKGEVVQIIGKAKETGWYRCMALREAKIELDKSTFPFLVRSMINLQSSSKKNSLVSGITPEMIEEEYSMRDLSESLSSDTYTEVSWFKQLLISRNFKLLKIYDIGVS